MSTLIYLLLKLARLAAFALLTGLFIYLGL